MERLTKDDLNKVCYDPWEICGMDKHCTKGCHEEGGCTGGCHILKMVRKLADYEDLEEQGLLVRKKGKWELLDDCANAGVYCSNCSKKVYRVDYANQKVKSKYCPACGAKMEE